MLHDILMIIIGLIPGLIIGFFLARFFMQLNAYKKPQITENMIKIMMSSMGRTPTQKQINQVMKQMNKVNSKK